MTHRADDLNAVLAHFNAEYRHRFHLRSLRSDELPQLPDLADTLGLPDPGCAAVARAVVDGTPRYVWGTIINGTVITSDQQSVSLDALQGCNVIVENPRGGIDNWRVVSGHVRALHTNRREESIALLAIREDDTWDAESGRLVSVEEFLPTEWLAETAYIYRISEDTVRAYQDRTRPDRKRPASRGRPRKSGKVGF